MTVNNSLNRGQTNPGAGEFVCRVQALKGRKQLVRERQLETRAVVPHEEGRNSVFFRCSTRLPADIAAASVACLSSGSTYGFYRPWVERLWAN